MLRRAVAQKWQNLRMGAATASEPVDMRLLPAALVCWAVTFLAIRYDLGPVAFLTLLLSAALVGVLASSGVVTIPAAVLLISVMLLGSGLALSAALRVRQAAQNPLTGMAGTAVTLRVTVDDDPKALAGKSLREQRTVVAATARELLLPRTGNLGGRVVIIAPAHSWTGVLPGQTLVVRGEVQRPRQRDLTVAVIRTATAPQLLGAPPWQQRAAGAVRTRFAAASGRWLPDDAAGLLPALVVGDTSRLPATVRAQFKTVGLSHLTSVSGANVAILLAAVLGMARTLTLGPRVSFVLTVVALLGFVVLARPSPSVLRAAAMGMVGLVSLLIGRRKQALPALCTAILVLLACWPALAVDAGFALSVLATGGLIVLAPGWADWLHERGWWRAPAEGLAVAAAACAVTAPVLVGLTGQLNTLTVAANLLVAVVIAPITVLGALAAAGAAVAVPIGAVLAAMTAPLMWWLLLVAQQLSVLPGATVRVPSGAGSGAVAAVVVALINWAVRSVSVRKCVVAAAAFMVVVLAPDRLPLMMDLLPAPVSDLVIGRARQVPPVSHPVLTLHGRNPHAVFVIPRGPPTLLRDQVSGLFFPGLRGCCVSPV